MTKIGYVISLSFFCLAHCSSLNEVTINSEADINEVVVTSMSSNEEIFTKTVKSKNDLKIPKINTGFGAEIVKVELLKDKNIIYSALVSKDFKGDTINVGPLTTLVSCMYSASFENAVSEIEDKVKSFNEVIESHLELESIYSPETLLDETSVSLGQEKKHEILNGAFEILSSGYDAEIETSDFIRELCEDFDFDQKFDGMGENGAIHIGERNLDEQALKAELAGAIYQYGIDKYATDEDVIEDWAEEISRNNSTKLFEDAIDNYPFETNAPTMAFWDPDGSPGFQIDTLDVDFTLADNSGFPRFFKVDVVFNETGNRYPISNDIDHPSHFISTFVIGNLEEGTAKIKIVAEDIFGNVSSFSYDIDVVAP
jgi:hypothetical protein